MLSTFVVPFDYCLYSVIIINCFIVSSPVPNKTYEAGKKNILAPRYVCVFRRCTQLGAFSDDKI